MDGLDAGKNPNNALELAPNQTEGRRLENWLRITNYATESRRHFRHFRNVTAHSNGSVDDVEGDESSALVEST